MGTRRGQCRVPRLFVIYFTLRCLLLQSSPRPRKLPSLLPFSSLWVSNPISSEWPRRAVIFRTSSFVFSFIIQESDIQRFPAHIFRWPLEPQNLIVAPSYPKIVPVHNRIAPKALRAGRARPSPQLSL